MAALSIRFPGKPSSPTQSLLLAAGHNNVKLSPFSPLCCRFSAKQFVEQWASSRVLAVRTTTTRCSLSYRDAAAAADAANGHKEAYPKPSEIQWKKELCNSVQLIGIVGTPVQINQLGSGKVVARTRLAVRKSPSETSWINLTFWDDMAHIAYQHLEKGNQVYVSGRLVSDTVESEDGKQQTYYKVVVQELNFVERNFSSPVALYNEDGSSSLAGAKFNSSGVNNNKLSPEALWQAFFANPVDWWDNRKDKKNPKYPDFKHKDTGEALWLESRYTPPWVKSQLEILDSKMEALHNKDHGRQFEFLHEGLYPRS